MKLCVTESLKEAEISDTLIGVMVITPYGSFDIMILRK
jgi:hypothetical protein